ncbi:hypothetical protein J2Z66_008201 [Paenibacillus eucommiae]|uniref:Uncharacterized protein n=1 Tax=Paenibacillus eucommiae TaxID=1355755 RepID=A0ABS4J9L5_9BACL|nr:hypothetical protein [Paenibacillus eucommiae]
MLTNEWIDIAGNWLIDTERGQTDKKKELYTYYNGRLIKFG